MKPRSRASGEVGGSRRRYLGPGSEGERGGERERGHHSSAGVQGYRREYSNPQVQQNYHVSSSETSHRVSPHKRPISPSSSSLPAHKRRFVALRSPPTHPSLLSAGERTLGGVFGSTGVRSSADSVVGCGAEGQGRSQEGGARQRYWIGHDESVAWEWRQRKGRSLEGIRNEGGKTCQEGSSEDEQRGRRSWEGVVGGDSREWRREERGGVREGRGGGKDRYEESRQGKRQDTEREKRREGDGGAGMRERSGEGRNLCGENRQGRREGMGEKRRCWEMGGRRSVEGQGRQGTKQGWTERGEDRHGARRGKGRGGGGRGGEGKRRKEEMGSLRTVEEMDIDDDGSGAMSATFTVSMPEQFYEKTDNEEVGDQASVFSSPPHVDAPICLWYNL